jgi:hypothetical protein
MTSTLLMLLWLPLLTNTGAMSYYSYTIQEESWVSITGSSNVNTFECYSSSNFTKGNVIVDLNTDSKELLFTNASLALEISSFDCKNPFLNKDLYKALGAEKNPHISIELIDAEFLQIESASMRTGKLKVSLAITLNNKCKIINLPIQWIKVGDFAYRFVGSKEINMTDFEIKPPSPAFGLIKVSELISINFSLIINANPPYRNEGFAESLSKLIN